jgi:hypothetical protein
MSRRAPARINQRDKKDSPQRHRERKVNIISKIMAVMTRVIHS